LIVERIDETVLIVDRVSAIETERRDEAPFIKIQVVFLKVHFSLQELEFNPVVIIDRPACIEKASRSICVLS